MAGFRTKKCRHEQSRLLPPAHLRLYVDSLVWAIKHDQPNVAETGLNILGEFCEKVLQSPKEVPIACVFGGGGFSLLPWLVWKRRRVHCFVVFPICACHPSIYTENVSQVNAF